MKRTGPAFAFPAAVACLLAGCAPAAADVKIETWGTGQQGSHPKTVTIADAPDKAAVVRIDLSALPKAARIRRARLLVRRDPIDGSDVEALVACEIRPLRAPYQAGAEPSLGEKALAIPPPWYDHFDATDVVRQWVSGGRPNCGLYVKALPRWRRDATGLEITYEGKAAKPPPQAAGLKVLHRAGQSFITWKEIEDLFGDRPVTWGEIRGHLAKMDERRVVRYRVYRHRRRIDAGTLAGAELLAIVKPLSGFNVNSWSKERLINQVVFGDEDQGELANYNPFRGWDRDSQPGGRLVIPRFVIDAKAGPLPAGTGLYVHSAGEGGKAYYAVVTSVDGTANARDFSAANSLARPVAESPGRWEPVRQSGGGKEFGFDFPGRKLYYVTWVAPPLANRPRCFNWGVHLPPKLAGAAPLNVSFHENGFSYAKPIRRHDRSAIQIAGHDFDPVSGWYGYHECLGTLRSWEEGKVQPYTERRVLAFIEWVKKTWKIDGSRCFTDGRRMGGMGAVHLACKHPELFAYVLDDRGAVCCRDSEDLPVLEAAWGRVDWGMKNDQDVNVWDWQDLTWFLREKGPGWDLPVLSFSPWGHTAWQEGYPRKVVSDRMKRWGQSHRDFTRLFKALGDNRHMFFVDFDWGPTLAILPHWMDVTRGPIPVVTGSTDKKVKENADGPFIFFEPSGSSPSGWIHWHHRWRSADVVDKPDRLEMTLYAAGIEEITADVTPRRTVHFRPKPGEKLRWTNTCLAEGKKSWGQRKVWKKYPKRREIQSGTAVVDAHGLVTLKGILILATKSRIAIQRQEATP